jgi:hypothetical protein
MTWEQFTDVLPIITLILGYGGTRLSDRWREGQDRERDVRRRVADREDAALVALQEILPLLPVVESDVVKATNDLRSDAAETDPDKRYLPLRDALTKRHSQVERARVLATRVTEPGLRQTILDAIEGALMSLDKDNFDALFESDQRLEYAVNEAWDAVRGANEAIGVRLRASGSK